MVRQRCKEVEEKDHIRNWQPPITGEMIMAMLTSTGENSGYFKNAFRDAILDGEIENNYEAAYGLNAEKSKRSGSPEIKEIVFYDLSNCFTFEGSIVKKTRLFTGILQSGMCKASWICIKLS